MRANYEDIKRALARTEPFKGNSMSARWEGGVYTVRSYSTPIATFDPATGQRWTNDRRYSQTTSRHQTLVRAYLPGASAVAA